MIDFLLSMPTQPVKPFQLTSGNGWDKGQGQESGAGAGDGGVPEPAHAAGRSSRPL